MPLIEDRSRPSSMAMASRCTTAPIAAYRPSAVPAGRGGARPPAPPSVWQQEPHPPMPWPSAPTQPERRFGTTLEAAWTRISSESATPATCGRSRPVRTQQATSRYSRQTSRCAASKQTGHQVISCSTPSREQERPASWSSTWVAGSSESNSSPTTPRSRPSTWMQRCHSRNQRPAALSETVGGLCEHGRHGRTTRGGGGRRPSLP